MSDAPLCIVGIDPGIANCGVAIYTPADAHLFASVIRTTKRDGTDAARLAKLKNSAWLLLVCAGAGGEDERVVLAVETQYGSAKYGGKFASDTARGPAAVRGLFIGLAAAKGWEVVEVSPSAAKRAMTGNAKATKQQVQAMCEKRFGQKLAYDAADAAAIALAAEAELRVRAMTEEGAK